MSGQASTSLASRACMTPRTPRRPTSHLRPLSPLLLSLAIGCSGAPEELEGAESLAARAQALGPSADALPPGLAASLVSDIQLGGDPTRPPSQRGSWKSQPAPVSTGSAVYFTAFEESTGVELWKTDGTPEGTRLVRDLRPGPDGSFFSELVAVGDSVYFTAGNTLWKSDGTAEGTVEVRTSQGSTLQADDLVACNGRVFFHTLDYDTYQAFLWKSDGTPEGTVPLTSALMYRMGDSRAQASCAEGTLFFVGDTDYGSSTELWKSDGTVGGTVRLETVGMLGWGSTNLFATVGSRVFLNTFSYSELFWTSDGTPAGTWYVYNIANWVPSNLHSLGDKAFFTVAGWWGNSLWTSDGTLGGTQQFLDLPVADPPALPLGISVTGDTVLFSDAGRLYKSDGTAEGTVFLQNLHLWTQSLQAPTSATLLDGRVLFSAADHTGPRAWVSDGTPSGTTELHTAQGQRLLNAGNFTRLGDRVLFWADDGVHGAEPWSTDGTPEGTRLLRDIFRDDSSLPRDLTDVEGTLFFTAQDATHGRELWKTDGTAEGTALVKDFGQYNYQQPRKMTRVGNALFFFNEVSGLTLWKSDGTEAGTVLLRDLGRLAYTYQPRTAAVGSTFFFTAPAPGLGIELWKSDGTAEGTVLVKDLRPGSNTTGPEKLTAVGDLLFFIANDGTHGDELWKSDGTAEGTVLVKDLRPGAASSMDALSLRQLYAVGNTLFFTANNGVHGEELWKTDGTAEGTVLVEDLRPGAQTSAPADLTQVEGVLYFTADDGLHGRELWKSDGTPEGTVLVKDLLAGTRSTFPDVVWYAPRSSLLYGTDKGLYFAANDGVHGLEPWKSDGTASGTALLRDVLPGPADSGVERAGFVSVGPHGAVAFAASNGVNGLELWMTDGTPAGTRLVADVAEGAMSASPLFLTVSGPRLFFVADEGVHGRELWSVKQAAFKKR